MRSKRSDDLDPGKTGLRNHRVNHKMWDLPTRNPEDRFYYVLEPIGLHLVDRLVQILAGQPGSFEYGLCKTDPRRPGGRFTYPRQAEPLLKGQLLRQSVQVISGMSRDRVGHRLPLFRGARLPVV